MPCSLFNTDLQLYEMGNLSKQPVTRVKGLVQFCSTLTVLPATNPNCPWVYLSPLAEEAGGLEGMPDIWEDNLVLAAVCCWTRTSAASAQCINVFRSELSSKFLHPIHLQKLEHMIFACGIKEEMRPKLCHTDFTLVNIIDNNDYLSASLL